MRLISSMAGALLVVTAGSVAAAQGFPGYPGTHIRLDVRVDSVTHGGDSTRISYLVTNSPSSEEQLSRLTISAPSVGRAISYPDPRAAWRVWTHIGARDVIRWTVRDNVTLTPGKSARGLAYTATGLPGIVDARYEGYAEPVDIESMADDDPRLTDRMGEVTSVPLKMVGVVPMIATPTRAALISRLFGLTQQSCTLGWIPDATLCGALTAYLAAPSPPLLAYLARVAAARVRPGTMNDNAYWLLRSNAEIIRDFVQPSDIQLTYACGNRFTVRNLNFVPVTVRYDVVGTAEGGALTIPGLLGEEDQSRVRSITTSAAGTVTLSYQGQVIQSVPNLGTSCPR